MFDKKTDALIEARLPVTAWPQVVIEQNISRDIDELVASFWPPMKLAIVDDRNTAEAYGAQVFRALKGRFACTHVTLEGRLAADEETLQRVRLQTLSSDALVAVGSGTLNDLCKLVSAQAGKPYIVFPTAASMNGYLSANASITENGHKKTISARMPKAVFCDLSVIAAAPPRLNKSGLGDSLARPTAQADWLLSHLLLGTEYDALPFELLADVEPLLFERARGIAHRDSMSTRLLMQVLLISGMGMTLAKGSYPASQGEHMIAHAMHMMKRDKPLATLHGEEIGATTLTMASLQQAMLRDKPHLRGNEWNEEELSERYDSRIVAEAKGAFGVKEGLIRHPKREDRDPLLQLHRNWPEIAGRIEAITLPPEQLKRILEEAEAPATATSLGWNAEEYAYAVSSARYLRERFTFLDLTRD